MLRISWKTHDMLKDMKKHSNVPMLEFVEAVVTHIYGGGVVSMQALTFFMMYLDGKPMFVVAAKDAEKAENGLRSAELGKGIKTIRAVSLGEANLDDVQRLGTQAILSQLTQISTMLQMLLQKR